MSSKTNGSDESESKLEEYTVDIEPVIGKKQVTIPLPRKESTWANVNPAAPCLDVKEGTPTEEKRGQGREKSNSATPESSTPAESTSRRRTKSVEEKKKQQRRTSRTRKNTKEVEANANDEESENSEDKTYDVRLFHIWEEFMC